MIVISNRFLPEMNSYQDNAFPEMWLNQGNINSTKANESKRARLEMKRDSPRNCDISCLFDAPVTFRMPTSLDRFVALAVDKFMKLTQAVIRIAKAMIEKIYTVPIFPLGFHSIFVLDFK